MFMNMMCDHIVSWCMRAYEGDKGTTEAVRGMSYVVVEASGDEKGVHMRILKNE